MLEYMAMVSTRSRKAPDVPIPYNPILEENVVPTMERIMTAARDLLR